MCDLPAAIKQKRSLEEARRNVAEVLAIVLGCGEESR